MAQPETREIASYLRDGSVWVGHFVAGSTDLYFGDDRFSATHGLARVASAQATGSADAAAPQVHARTRSAGREDSGKASNVPQWDGIVERLKRAA